MNDFQNLTVESFTTPCPTSCGPQSSVNELIVKMENLGIRHIPVTNDLGQLLGVVSDRDLQTLKNSKLTNQLVAQDIMIKEPVVVDANMLLSDAVFRMSELKIGSLLVLNPEGSVDGIFTSTDALNALVEVLRGEVFS